MTGKQPAFRDDKTSPTRRKKLSEEQIKDLELAGGVEGGMQAGSAGGPGRGDVESSKDSSHDSEREPRLD